MSNFMSLTEWQLDLTAQWPAAVFRLVRLLSARIPTEEEEEEEEEKEEGGEEGEEGGGRKKKIPAGLPQTAERAQPCSPGQCAELAAYI